MILLCFAGPATAKCGKAFYEFTGTVVNDRGEPAVGAVVGVSWSETFGIAGPALGQTDAQGRYTIPVRAETFSRGSIFRGDVCGARLEEVSIVAYDGEKESRPLRLDIGRSWAVDVPDIAIDGSITSRPLFPEEMGVESVGMVVGEWSDGSVWRFTIDDGEDRPVQVVSLRVATDEANSCLGGDWKRLEVVDGAYDGLSEPAYEIEGTRLTVLLSSNICDNYDQLQGTVEGGLYRARHSAFGLGSGRTLGTGVAVRVE